jgi:hypothetical protein
MDPELTQALINIEEWDAGDGKGGILRVETHAIKTVSP